MPVVQSSSAALVEPDDEECVPDASVLQMAQELLALSGRGHLPTSMARVRPLRRPRNFTPCIVQEKTTDDCNKVNNSMVAISDDEDHGHGGSGKCTFIKRRREMTQVPTTSQKKQCLSLGGNPCSGLPLGRPLMAPPRLPCLPPGQALPAAAAARRQHPQTK